MSNSKWKISRRAALRGLGTALALPALDCMTPLVGWTAEGARAEAKGPPNRMAFLYVPNGVHMADFTPTTEGPDYALPPSLAPLADLRTDFMVLSGLMQDKGRPNGDGPGDHARALASFLTGCQPRKTSGADIKVGISVDQVAALSLGDATKFSSLEIGCEPGLNSGGCDSGYSCAYSGNSSWRTESTPMSKEIDPKLVFDRLFDSGESEADKARKKLRDKYKKSVLDFVAEDANRLKGRLGATDRRKLDEYLTGVRELEQRIARVEAETEKNRPSVAIPTGVPDDYREHIRVMGDLMVLAFQGDLTRVCTFVLANEGSNRAYPYLEVPEGHHDLSHHGDDKAKQAKLAKINRFHIEQFAYILGKMKSIGEGDGTLLDHSMVAYGSGLGDGNAHNHDNLPILLAGKGNGQLRSGRHLRYPDETPLNNLWLAMLAKMNVPTEKLGDSNGILTGLEA